jgi:hypothetical protein
MRVRRPESDLLFAGEHPIRFSLSLLSLVVATYALCRVWPAAWTPTSLAPLWVEWKEAENLTHFSTLWAVQATLAALVYPIVIAFVTVYLQKRPAADASLHLYVLDSGALAAGLSSLALVVVMAAQYVALPFIGTRELRSWAAIDAAWFFLNALLTAYFLFRTLDFLRADVQSRVIRRYAVTVALPRDIQRLNLFQLLAQAHSKGWIPGPSYVDKEAPEGPRIFLSRFSFGTGEPQGTLRIREPSRLINVRLWLLRIAVARWLMRARRWPRPPNTRRFRQDQWPLLTVHVTPGTEYRESMPLATVEAGPPLAHWQQALIRWACVFRPVRRERYEIRVKSILGELEADARGAAASGLAEAFERALEPLISLHTLLLGAALDKDEGGQVGSWASLPDILTSFERPIYEGWTNAYRSIFEAAINAMEINARPLLRLCNIVLLLHGDNLEHSPVPVSENVLQLPPLMMYQLANWWSRKIEEQGTTDHGAHQMAVLAAPQSSTYEEVISSFVGGWENAQVSIADIPDVAEGFTWSSAPTIATLNWTHLLETARMLLVAVLRGDKVAAEWLADVLSKWWGRYDLDRQAFALFDKADFVTFEHLNLEWEKVSTLLGIADEDLRWSGGRIEAVQRAVLVAALRNLWTDTRLLVVELLLSSVMEPGPFDGSLAFYIAAGLLSGRQWRSGGTLTDPLSTLSANGYLASKVRQYAGGADRPGSYETRLSGLISRVKDAERPRMIGSRAYSFMGADDIGSLREQQVAVFVLLSNREWRPGESLRRQINLWMESRYESIDIVRFAVDGWLRLLEQAPELSPNLLGALLTATGKSHDAAEGVQRAKLGFESLKDLVESLRTEALAAQPIDPERLLEIAQFASSKAFTAASGKFPIQMFACLDTSRGPLEDFTLVSERMPKGELTRTAMDQRAGNEQQFWADTLALQVGALLLNDVLGKAEPQELFVGDPASFWTALKAEAARFFARHTHPILILDNAARPEWVWNWTHGDYGSEYPRPDDLNVRRVEGRGDGYVCDFNEIEIYVGPVPPGYSLLVAREAFHSVVFKEFEPGRYVDVTCAPRPDSNVLVDLRLRVSRRVNVGDTHWVRLRYGANSAKPLASGRGQ